MDIRNYLMPVAALLVTVAFGYGIYIIGSGLMTEGEGHKVNPEKILLAALEKPTEYANGIYTYEYVDSYDGYPISTRMVHSTEFALVKVTSPVFEKAIYMDRDLGMNALCVRFNNNESCAEVSRNSTLAPAFESMKKALFTNRALGDAERMEIYIGRGAVKFAEKTERRSEGEKECSAVKYVLDYSLLTFADLEKLGMSPSDPALLYSKNYSIEYCIDNESNILFIKMDYTFLGQEKRTETKVIASDWGVANRSEFKFPQTANESETESLFLNAISAEKSVLACSKNLTTKDSCIRTYAVQNSAPDLCLLAGTAKDKCILLIAPRKLRADLCGKVDNSPLRDDCWIEIAARTNESILCANISDGEKNAYCLSLMPAPAGCTSDADCFRAGCSGELCVSEEMRDVITTCEYRAEYACLKFTNCGCIDGVCGWALNKNYTKCLSEIKTRANNTS